MIFSQINPNQHSSIKSNSMVNFGKYHKGKSEIYPIEKGISSPEINAICNSLKSAKCIGEGMNGQVYTLGRDLVVKKSKQNALVNTDTKSEAEKLKLLNKLMKETNNDLDNSQKGIVSFNLNNSESYLISSLVKGETADGYKNNLNSKNLGSLINILTQLDKGTDDEGRFLLYDANLGNLKFTRQKGGLLDVEYMQTKNLDECIKNIIIDGNKRNSLTHGGDTSNIESNIRSFEFAGLYHYMQDLPPEDVKDFFKMYLKTKSNYHKEMSKHYIEKAQDSSYPEIMTKLSNSEAVHSKILSSDKLPDDILKAEAMKIQMSNFRFVSGKYCNSSTLTFNPRQIVQYKDDCLTYFEKKLFEAIDSDDEDRICYFKNCINHFDYKNEPNYLYEKMIDTQKSRVRKYSIKTLDKLCVS